MVQPILRGRQITWNQHAVLGGLGDRGTGELQSILSSPAIEVAWTPVKEGKVQGYYAQFAKVVNPILTDEPVCDGFFISPHLENPHDQILLINWKSVDVCQVPHLRFVCMIANHKRARPTTSSLKTKKPLSSVLMHCMITMPDLLFRGTLLDLRDSWPDTRLSVFPASGSLFTMRIGPVS
jgi:hypothetical protein